MRTRWSQPTTTLQLRIFRRSIPLRIRSAERTAEKLIAKVKTGRGFCFVLGAPQNAAKYPSVKVVPVFSHFDRKTLEFMAEAVRDGKLVIPIGLRLPLSEAGKAQALAEKGGIGKILLLT